MAMGKHLKATPMRLLVLTITVFLYQSRYCRTFRSSLLRLATIFQTTAKHTYLAKSQTD